MDLRHLRAAVAVARALSFTRAAEAVGIAQPLLSQQVAALEREIGVRLFERTKRRVIPTDAGRTFAARAERILAEVQSLAEEMSAYAGGLRGRVVLGTYQSFAEYTLPKLLAAFHRRHPAVEVALREGLADDLLAGLHAGAIDVVICDLGDSDAVPAGLRIEALYRDELALAVSPSHRLAKRKRVRIAELRDEPFVIFRPGSSLTGRLIALARAARFEPRVAFESTDSLTVRSLVAEGLGIALFPRALGTMPGPPIALPALDPPVVREMSMMLRRQAAPSVRAFTDFIRDILTP